MCAEKRNISRKVVEQVLFDPYIESILATTILSTRLPLAGDRGEIKTIVIITERERQRERIWEREKDSSKERGKE